MIGEKLDCKTKDVIDNFWKIISLHFRPARDLCPALLIAHRIKIQVISTLNNCICISWDNKYCSSQKIQAKKDESTPFWTYLWLGSSFPVEVLSKHSWTLSWTTTNFYFETNQIDNFEVKKTQLAGRKTFCKFLDHQYNYKTTQDRTELGQTITCKLLITHNKNREMRNKSVIIDNFNQHHHPLAFIFKSY